MRSTLAETLKRQLPEASEEHLLRLAEMLSKPAATPNRSTIAGLLDEGCDPNSLHAAILFGRETAIEALSVSNEMLPELNAALSRFDRMVSIMMHHLVGQLEAQLTDREQESLLSRALVQWMHQGEIELYNYFMEMPVKARVRIRDAHERILTVERNSDLVSTIAAGEHGRGVTAVLPDSDFALMLEVAGVFGDRISLRQVGIVPQVRERRRYARVQPEPLLPVTVDITGSGRLAVKAMDYSENGMGLVLHRRMPAKCGHVVRVDWFMLGKELSASATIRWLQQDQGNTRLGIELMPDAATHAELQHMVARTQRHILTRLRMKGVPDSLL